MVAVIRERALDVWEDDANTRGHFDIQTLAFTGEIGLACDCGAKLSIREDGSNPVANTSWTGQCPIGINSTKESK